MSDDTISQFIEELGSHVRTALTTSVEMMDVSTFPKVDEMYVEAPKWHRIQDVVCVVADLKNSTKLNFDTYANSSAKLYEALTSNMVRTVDRFAPDFVDIQGDGIFALFHGSLRYERAFAAGVSLKTFSELELVPQIEAAFPRMPATGLKVGMHAARVVVKKVGIRGTNEPVWAGKLVNWAFKAAQSADVHEMVVTEKVYRHFEDNSLVTQSCGCPTGVRASLWADRHVDVLPDTDARCRMLRSKWCESHGDDYCKWILEGKKNPVEEAA